MPCLKCWKTINVLDEDVGDEVVCPHCNTHFIASLVGQPLPPGPPSWREKLSAMTGPAAATMVLSCGVSAAASGMNIAVPLLVSQDPRARIAESPFHILGLCAVIVVLAVLISMVYAASRSLRKLGWRAIIVTGIVLNVLFGAYYLGLAVLPMYFRFLLESDRFLEHLKSAINNWSQFLLLMLFAANLMAGVVNVVAALRAALVMMNPDFRAWYSCLP